MFSNPDVRKWAYVAQAVIGAALLALVAAGVVTQEFSDSLTAAVGGLLGVVLVGGGELARRNIAPKPSTITADGVAVIADALDAYAAKAHPAIVSGQRAAQSALEAVVADARNRLLPGDR